MSGLRWISEARELFKGIMVAPVERHVKRDNTAKARSEAHHLQKKWLS